MKKRFAFTLLELLLTFSLFSFIIATFFSWTHAHLTQKKSFEKVRWPLIEERYLAERIDRLLSEATLTKSEPNEILHFSGEKESLLFTFDNGVFSDPLLSYKTRCLLEKKEDRLECLLFPLENRGNLPSVRYTLMDGIESLTFTYYQPQDPLALPIHPNQVGSLKAPQGENTFWKEEYHALPAYVSLTITRGGRSAKFLFDLHYPIILPGHQESS